MKYLKNRIFCYWSWKILALVSFLSFYLFVPAFSQETSLKISQSTHQKRKVIPHKASMYSAVIPGLGQAYNGKYWKIPIIYAGFAGLGAMVVFYDNNYQRYKTAFQYRTDGNPNTIDEFASDSRYTPEILTAFKDFNRRNRDQSIIFMFAFYALNIIDATVDAHFLNFDISEDLSLRLEPLAPIPFSVFPTSNSNFFGLKASVSF